MTTDEREDLKLRAESRRWQCYALALYGSVLAIGYLVLVEVL